MKIAILPHFSSVIELSGNYMLPFCTARIEPLALYYKFDPYITRVLNFAIPLFCIKLQEYKTGTWNFYPNFS